MITKASHASGTAVLRPRARLVHTFGDELVSSEKVAVIELVKNAYDADATRVLVRFRAPLERGRGAVEVLDNGHGMSLDTVRTAWMEPATVNRRRAVYSQGRNRRVLGEKGIGRFAASRLADNLELVTRRDSSDLELRAFFDWRQFDDEDKYLDEVTIPWEEREPIEICPGGEIQSLWSDDERPKKKDLAHGTILRMTSIRMDWDRGRIEALRSDLSRLISPVLYRHLVDRQDAFQVRLDLPPGYQDLAGVISPPDMFEHPHYRIRGDVSQSGQYDLRLKMWTDDSEERITGRFTLPGERIPSCGPFDIELRAWDREAEQMEQLAKRYNLTIGDVRRDLDNVAGINIYRDGFRVLPYGDPKNDWLRLDLRRVQNPTLRLSNNQIVGYVFISADTNPDLRDQSNREGLMEGPALRDLRELVMMVLSLLEVRRYSARHPESAREESPTSPPTSRGGLFSGFDLSEVRDMVKQRHPSDEGLLLAIDQKEKVLESRVDEVRKILARYHRLATLGQLIDSVLHDARAPLSKIRNEAFLALRDITNGQGLVGGLVHRLAGRIRLIEAQADVVATVFRRIEPFGGRKRGRPSQARLENIIRDAFGVLQSDVENTGTKVSLPDSATVVTVDHAEIEEIIINLLQNSLHWLLDVPRSRREIEVHVSRTQPDAVEIIFSDSGPGVPQAIREHIFEPYFSSKPDGTGLGLTIAGEIISEYYSGTLELLDGGPLPGATFRILLRKRI